MDNLDVLCKNLRNYFTTRSDIAMAFLFGSAAREEQTADSDLDIAVYFYPKTKALEWEEEAEFPSTDEVWEDIDSITSSNTDLVVLNRAPATLAYAILDDSRSIIIKDTALYWRFFLTISSAAEDFRQFAREYLDIRWTRISTFVQEAVPEYEYLANYTVKLLSAGGEQI